MTPLASRIHHASNDDLVTVYRFFSSPLIKRFYTGLLDDIRLELQQRGIDVLEAIKALPRDSDDDGGF